ncbi:UNVERIFIED_CONTAM: hypothetical protein O8I53_06195 [Campylobacter lari]
MSRRSKNLKTKYIPQIFSQEKDFAEALNYTNNYFGQFQSINNG